MNIKEACRKIALTEGLWFVLAMTGAGFSIEVIRDHPEFAIFGGLLFVGKLVFGLGDYALMKMAIAEYQKEEEKE